MNRDLFVLVNSGWARPGLDRFMVAATMWANPIVLFASAALLLALRDRARLRQNVALLATALILAIVVSEPLKFVFNTPRPLLALGAANVRVLGKPELLRGFPSGHTARAFAVATAFVGRYPSLGGLLMLGAALVGVSRIYVGAHFPADVAGGLVIGILCGWGAGRLVKR